MAIRSYRALSEKGLGIITVFALTEGHARIKIRQELGRNPSRRHYLKGWEEGGYKMVMVSPEDAQETSLNSLKKLEKELGRLEEDLTSINTEGLEEARDLISKALGLLMDAEMFVSLEIAYRDVTDA